MPQMHLYVPQEIADEVRRRAARRGLSVSRYLAELVRSQVLDAWPEGWFESVVGGWQGGRLERPEQGELEERSRLEPPG